jgi:hypothetical protein
MADKIYLIDIDVASSFSEEFINFFTDFLCDVPTAILTAKSSAELPSTWIESARYVFASDANEVYVNNKLRYKNIIELTYEVRKWIQATQLSSVSYLHKVMLTADPYTSASLVREFNELFSEFRAESCTGGFYITDYSDSRRAVPALISSNYSIRFITPIGLLGGVNFGLANSIKARGSVFHVSSEAQLRELLLFLQEK